MSKADIRDYRLHAREGEEQYIPKYGIEQDAKFFDLDSLIRIYGEEEVTKFLKRVRDVR